MSEHKGLLSSGLGMVLHNKRYIVWFYVLNLFLGLFGTVAFVNQAGTILDHSLHSDRLVHGFSVTVLIDMFARPEFGPTMASRGPAMFFAVLFLLATALFLPGVFQGYASTYRLPREDFFRACGRNLWRYIRLLLIAGIVMTVATIALFALHGVLERKAAESTNELLLPEVRFIGLFVIFLIMTVFRIWFDLAEADIVLSDQRAVRKSIGAGFRHTFRGLGRLLSELRGRCDCRGDHPRRRNLDVDEARPVNQCGRGIPRRPIHSDFVVDPALLAAGRRRLVLAAAHACARRGGGTCSSAACSGCGRRAHHSADHPAAHSRGSVAARQSVRFCGHRARLMCRLPFLAEVQAEFRFGPRPRHLERQFRSRTVLAEERIHRLEQHRFPSRHHLREFRIEFRGAVKIEDVAVQTVLASDIGMRPWHGKVQQRKCEQPLVEPEYATDF